MTIDIKAMRERAAAAKAAYQELCGWAVQIGADEPLPPPSAHLAADVEALAAEVERTRAQLCAQDEDEPLRIEIATLEIERDILRADCDALRAEVDRMRRLVTVAQDYRHRRACGGILEFAVDAYEAGQ